ncbi:MAG: ATP-grasp domain-containing protein [Methanobacteriaceae archaeon]|nr:ATP-grasp domain-containing protein [Methanobacteriaceae archaeon]
MKLLVFEYATTEKNQESLSVEGYNILKSVIEDLDNIDIDTTYIISNTFTPIKTKNIKKIILNKPLYSWLKENLIYYDTCLFVAPSENNIQYNLTKFIEKYNITILGSSSHASYITSNKSKTYQLLNSKKKYKIPLYEINNLNHTKIKNKKVMVLKPNTGTSTTETYLIKNEKEYNKIIKHYEDINITSYILQEYISGINLSVSILVNNENSYPICLNMQKIEIINNKFKYNGCITPYEHKLKEKIFEISKDIVNEIPFLKGFIGLDFIITPNDIIYLIEINSRITTPYIIIHKLSNVNLIKQIIKVVENKIPEKICLNGKKEFNK